MLTKASDLLESFHPDFFSLTSLELKKGMTTVDLVLTGIRMT